MVNNLLLIFQEASLLLSAQDHPYSQELYHKIIKVYIFATVSDHIITLLFHRLKNYRNILPIHQEFVI